MKELKANLWDVFKQYNAICCTTNYITRQDGHLVMGAGIAREFQNHYNFLPKLWGQRVLQGHNPCFITLMKSEPHLVFFQTKKHWKDPSDITLIKQSLVKLGELIKMVGLRSVLLPRPGCKNGGLDWYKDVLPVIGPYLDKYEDIITVIHNDKV